MPQVKRRSQRGTAGKNPKYDDFYSDKPPVKSKKQKTSTLDDMDIPAGDILSLIHI